MSENDGQAGGKRDGGLAGRLLFSFLNPCFHSINVQTVISLHTKCDLPCFVFGLSLILRDRRIKELKKHRVLQVLQ